MKYKTAVFFLMAGFAFAGAGASAQTTSAKISIEAPGDSFTQTDASKRAAAYADFMRGHLAEMQFDQTGKPEYAQQAIEAYKQALALDQDASITERLAEIYAASQHTQEAIQEAELALQQYPDNLAAHRLLARIYIHELSEVNPDDSQKGVIAQAVEHLEAIKRLDSPDIQSQIWLARLYGFENQPNKTEEVLKGVLAHAADNEDALEQLSQLYLDEGRNQAAVSLLENAANNSNDPTLDDLLGSAYVKLNDYPKAEEAYRQAIALDPGDASHRQGLAQALLSDEKFNEALAQYQQLVKIQPDSPENYLRISQIYRHLGQLDKAEASLTQAKKYAPGSIEVLYNEALLYEAEARYKEAEEVLSDALAGVKAQQQEGQPAPHAVAILYEQLGMAFREGGDFNSAERTFEEMEQLGPAEKKRGELLLIDTYRSSGDIKRAIAEAEKARAADPSNDELAVTYAMLLGDNAQTDAATKVLRGLVRGNASADREIYLDLAQVEQRGKRYSQAEKDANRALAVSSSSGDKEAAWFMLGAIYDQQKRYDRAEEMFKKSLAVNSHDAMVLNYYGYMLADRGIRLDEAISMIRSAVQQDPTNGAYLDSLGWAYFKQGNLTEAKRYCEEAVAHSSNDPTIIGHLGDVYAKLGQVDDARKTWVRALSCWQKALPADYDSEKVAQLQGKLRDLKRHVAQKSSGE